MSCDCQIRVSSSGKYCCDLNQLLIRENCLATVNYSNLPPIIIEMETTPGNWGPADPAVIEGTGTAHILTPGSYRFLFDCESIDGTNAPAEGAMGLCYECCKVESYDQLILACLLDLKGLIVAGGDATAIAEIIANLEAICDKLLVLISNIGDLSELCAKLEEVITSLDALCIKVEENFAEMLECLNKVKEQLSELNNTITIGFEQLCSKLENEEGETAIDKLCEIRDFFDSVKTTCAVDLIPDADYNAGSAWVTGRPNTGVLWELIDNRDPFNQIVVASGANFNAFVADLESKGYTEWSFGETHYICPCPPGLVNAGDYFTQANGETVTKMSCTPALELPEFPTKEAVEESCAIATKDCNSDAILAALETLIEINTASFEKLCELVGDPDAPCPDCPPVAKEAVTYENSDNETELAVSVGGSGDIKIDAGGGDGSEADVVNCIESCLAAGDDVNISWTTADGGSGTATLLAGATTNAFPNFYNQSTNASGDSGKLLTLTCE